MKQFKQAIPYILVIIMLCLKISGIINIPWLLVFVPILIGRCLALAALFLILGFYLSAIIGIITLTLIQTSIAITSQFFYDIKSRAMQFLRR